MDEGSLGHERYEKSTGMDIGSGMFNFRYLLFSSANALSTDDIVPHSNALGTGNSAYTMHVRITASPLN
jgi:hypothetical protein